MTTYDQGLAAFKDLENQTLLRDQTDLNEDTTRLRLIDSLLFECLGWDKYEHALTEENTVAGIIDYSLRPSSTIGPLLIVEAKKTGISFVLPIESRKRKSSICRSILAVSSLNQAIANAITQAARYALEQGAPFACVTNGHQLIAFTVRTEPGVKWRDGQALVFESLAQIGENFLDFWNALSLSGVRDFHLSRVLTKLATAQPPPRRSETISNYGRTKNRNNFQADLQIVGDLVFGGRIFEDRTLFHEYCYCAAGALPQYSRATRSYLEDRYPEFFVSTSNAPALEPAMTKKGPADALINLTNIRKPILLLGDVGVGKSTFLEHLFLVDWADKKDDLIVIRVDLADKPSRVEDVPKTVREQIDSALLEIYGIDTQEDRFLRGAYHSELARFRRSPEVVAISEDLAALRRLEAAHLTKLQLRFDEHIKAIFKHIVKGRKKMVVLVFDNVDQRSADLQSATFIQAQIAASTWEVFAILALRPETFVRAKLDGAISGYHPRAFTISPPRFDHLLIRRIETARKMLNGELPMPSLGPGIAAHLTSVGDYLDVLLFSFSNNPELIGFCEDISGGNMRLALDYVVQFMSSGHVDAPKILERWREHKRYIIPLHEFVRGVMFSDREYYTGRAANVINVFEFYSGDPRETFIILALLTCLDMPSFQPNDSEYIGFLPVSMATSALLSVGYSPSQAERVISAALASRLVETNLKSPQIDVDTHIRVTSTGAYYLSALVGTFVYIDAVCLDTPIADRDVFSRIQDVQVLDARLQRAEAFIEYLNRLIERYVEIKTILPWEAISLKLNTSIQKVKANKERAYSRRG